MYVILAGFAGGVLGGMGMGGGILLIPILTLLLNVPQKEAQMINLAAFIPMAAVTLVIHAKNKFIDKKRLLFLIIPAVLAVIPSAYLAAAASAENLKKAFGVFLIVLGGASLLYQVLKSQIQRKTAKFCSFLMKYPM